MRKYIQTLVWCLLSVAAWAQQTPIEKYPLAPADYQHVYLDFVEKNPVKIITNSRGQYVGQVNSDNLLYGYGMFVNDDGSQIIGQFRNGKLLFGITLSSESAMVGNPAFYANYSLTTGKLEYIFHANRKEVMDTNGLFDYGFVSMRYMNGDQYIGEVYQRRRHGYGIYYYANGDIWFGEYKDDIRCGFGCLFDKDNHLTLGCWEGEDLRRSITPASKK